MKIEKFRDLTLIDMNEDQTMVIACDSTGAIGSKEYDIVKIDNKGIGYTSSVVAIMEVLAFGAKPVTVVNNLCVEMEPTGREILEGLKMALGELDEFDYNYLTGTTEENFVTKSTGIGITVIGLVDKREWKRPKTDAGDIAVNLGIAMIGDDVVREMNSGRKNIMTVEKMVKLRKLPYVKEILPVGSKGIRYEWAELCRTNDLDCEIRPGLEIDLAKSAGPATCSIVSLIEEDFEKLKSEIDIPMTKLGRFISRDI